MQRCHNWLSRPLCRYSDLWPAKSALVDCKPCHQTSSLHHRCQSSRNFLKLIACPPSALLLLPFFYIAVIRFVAFFTVAHFSGAQISGCRYCRGYIGVAFYSILHFSLPIFLLPFLPLPNFPIAQFSVALFSVAFFRCRFYLLLLNHPRMSLLGLQNYKWHLGSVGCGRMWPVWLSSVQRARRVGGENIKRKK